MKGVKKKMKRIKKIKGFSLTEMVVVIVMVMILSVISVPVYNSYTEKAEIAEGYALLGRIRTAQDSYFSEYGNFLINDDTSLRTGYGYTCNEEILGINARANKYFTQFAVNGVNNSYGVHLDPGPASSKYLVVSAVYSRRFFIGMIYNITTGFTYKLTKTN